MKFLVLGSVGMAGHQISLYLKEKGHDVTGFARNELDGIKTIVGDVRNTDLLSKSIASGNYDSVSKALFSFVYRV